MNFKFVVNYYFYYRIIYFNDFEKFYVLTLYINTGLCQ